MQHFWLDQIGGIVAEEIKESMACREVLLLHSKILLTSVYVDPIHVEYLNEIQQTKERKTLLEVEFFIEEFDKNGDHSVQEEVSINSSSDSVQNSPNSEVEHAFLFYFIFFFFEWEVAVKKPKRLGAKGKEGICTKKAKFRQDFIHNRKFRTSFQIYSC